MDFLHSWWFYSAIAAAYLLIGIKFGSLNYKVAKNPDNYSYLVRFLLYPVFTLFREGWMDTIKGNNEPFENSLTFIGLCLYGPLTYPRVSYMTVLSVSWLVKVAINALFIVTIFLISAGCFLFILASLAIGIVINKGIEVLVRLFGWLS